MSRTLPVAASFAIVLVTYWAYSLVAVGLIEPTFDAAERDGKSAGSIPVVRNRTAELAPFFPPGSWELENPKILASDQVKLLIGDYEPQEDGSVKLSPCTILFTPGKATDSPATRREKTVILEAPDGAILKFDQPFDLGRAKIGALVGGRLLGQITIRGAGKPDDPDDDLLIVTHEVQLTEEHIWTPHPVQFRFGPHFGQGREMHFRFLPGDESGVSSRGKHGPSMGGLESFELRHVERLRLEVPDKEVSADSKSKPEPPPASQPLPDSKTIASPASQSKPKPTLPVEITCRGPFFFDAVQQTARFEDQVAVARLHPDGPSDELKNCDKLTVYFAPPRVKDVNADAKEDKKSKDDKKEPRLPDLEPQRLEARGNPVVILSPREKVEARGEHLEYDLTDGRILLDGRQPVYLRRGPSEIHAPLLQYTPDKEKGKLGRIVAEGPGWLVGQMDDKPNERLEARWNKSLRVLPDQQNQLISLTGGVELKYGAIGRMSAGEIHFWLTELPDSVKADGDKSDGDESGLPRFQPDRMQADGNVQLGSPEISGAVDQLQVWFEPDKKALGGYRTRIEKTGSGSPPQTHRLPSLTPTRQPPGVVAKKPSRHFHVTARLLQARVILRDREDERDSELAELTIVDRVELVETQTETPDDKPIIFRGDRLHAGDVSRPEAWVEMTGRPARFEGQGLGLSGANINLNRGTNRLWVDGPGFMDLPPLKNDLQGRPITNKNAGPMQIHWRKGMNFDGRTVRFEESVVATSEHQQLRTELMEASFQQVIRFNEAEDQMQSDEPPVIERISCQGGVRMDSRSYENGEQQSIENVEVRNLVINNASGAMTAQGPGWVKSVQRGKPDMAAVSGLGTSNAQPGGAPEPADDEDGFTYLHVRFQGSITGNVHQDEMTFHDQVRATFGSVPSWQATLPDDDPDALGDEGALLGCEHLSVVAMPSPMGKGRSIELQANGNTTVEGRDFMARGTRMTYDQAKKMLILEGDGRTDATLFYQEKIGAAPGEFRGQKITYWPETRNGRADGVRSLQF